MIQLKPQSFLNTVCSNSTFPGLKYFYFAKSLIDKCFWLVITLTGFGIATHTSVGIIRQYAAAPIYTVITQEHSDSLEFPTFTLCLAFRTTNDKLNRLNITSVSDVNYLYHSLVTLTSPVNFDYSVAESVIKTTKSHSRVNELLQTYSIVDLYRHLTPNCSEIGFWCSVGPNAPMTACCSEMSEKVYISSNGPCYSFDSMKYTQKIKSTIGKVAVLISLPKLSEIPNTTFYAYMADGVQFYTTNVTASFDDNPLLIPRGSTVIISLQRTLRILLDSAQRPCVTGDVPYERCLYQCVYSANVEMCGCTGINTFYELDHREVCSPLQAYECMVKSKNIRRQITAEIFANCTSCCTVPCRTVKYTASMTMSPIRSDYSWRISEGSPGDKVAIGIHYPDMLTTVIEEKYSYRWETLVSNIGGTYGLWVGAIVAGIVHFLHTLVLFIFRKLDGKLRDSLSNNVNRTSAAEQKPCAPF